MPSQFEQVYKVPRGGAALTDAFFNRRFANVDDRLTDLEARKIAWDEALRIVQDRVLERSEQVIASLRDQLVAITTLDWLTARSGTERTLAAGTAVAMLIDEGDRALFAPGSWSILCRAGSAADFAVVRTLAFDRDLGQWDIHVEAVAGDPGPHDDWEIGALAGSTLAQMQLLAQAQGIQASITALHGAAQGFAALTGQDASNTAFDRIATAQAVLAAAAQVAMAVAAKDAAVAARDAAQTFNPASYYGKTAIDGMLAPLAPKADAALTGNPTAPTPPAGDSDTSIATTAFVAGATASLTGGQVALTLALTGAR